MPVSLAEVFLRCHALRFAVGKTLVESPHFLPLLMVPVGGRILRLAKDGDHRGGRTRYF
jgi:hypothetical protein